MSTRTALRAGDRVTVPWGVDTRDGEISAVYHTGDVERVLVRLDPSESTGGEAQTVVFPAEAVKPLPDKPDLPEPGTWLRGYRYEREVAEALNRVLASEHPTVQLNAEISGKEVDVLVETSHGAMIVEVKSVDKLSQRLFEAAIRQLRTIMAAFPGAKGLLVTPSVLSASVTKRTRQDGLLSSDVGVARWRSLQDDKQLGRVTYALLSGNPGGMHDAEA